MKKIFLGSVFIALLMAGCEKEDSIPTRFTPNPSGNTNVKFLMLSPDAPQVNLFTNGIKSTSVLPTSAGVLQGMGYPSIYPTIVGYTTIPSGSTNIEMKKASDSSVLFTSTESFDAGKFYSYFLFDRLNNVSKVAVEDDLSVPNSNLAYLRLANFTSDTTALKFEFRKTTGSTYPYTITSTNNIAFKTVTAFQELEPASYRVYLRNKNDIILDSITTFSAIAGRKYTVYSRGIYNNTATRPIITSYTNL